MVLLVAVSGWIGWLVLKNSSGGRYQGKSIREWAAELQRTDEPRGTNAAAAAFRELGGAAAPALRSLVGLRAPFYENTLVKHARLIPPKPRTYLFQKLQPGHTIEIRLGAIRALGIIGPAARDALPEMLAALRDPDSRVRWAAAQTICRLGPAAVTALIPLTTNRDASLRHAAVYALGEARTNALPAALALVQCTLDTNVAVCASAYYSLSRIGPVALPLIVAQADTNTDPVFRNAALRALIALRPPPGRVLSSHLQISTNTAEMRRLAMFTVSLSRLTNHHALNLLSNGLADESPEVREAAGLGLRRLQTGVMFDRTNLLRTAPNPQQ